MEQLQNCGILFGILPPGSILGVAVGLTSQRRTEVLSDQYDRLLAYCEADPYQCYRRALTTAKGGAKFFNYLWDLIPSTPQQTKSPAELAYEEALDTYLSTPYSKRDALPQSLYKTLDDFEKVKYASARGNSTMPYKRATPTTTTTTTRVSKRPRGNRARPTHGRYNSAARLQARTMGRPKSTTEVKCFDGGTPSAAALNAFGACAPNEPGVAFTGITWLNPILQDASVSGRVGNKIQVKSLHVKFRICGDLTSIATIRLMLVYDHAPNGALPVLADVVKDMPAGTSNATSSLNIANKGRFLVLRDQFESLGTERTNWFINWYVKGRWDVEYGANAGTIADCKTGSFLLIGGYLDKAGTTPVMQAGRVRFRYFD